MMVHIIVCFIFISIFLTSAHCYCRQNSISTYQIPTQHTYFINFRMQFQLRLFFVFFFFGLWNKIKLCVVFNVSIRYLLYVLVYCIWNIIFLYQQKIEIKWKYFVSVHHRRKKKKNHLLCSLVAFFNSVLSPRRSTTDKTSYNALILYRHNNIHIYYNTC